jgi:hypothetical protein
MGNPLKGIPGGSIEKIAVFYRVILENVRRIWNLPSISVWARRESRPESTNRPTDTIRAANACPYRRAPDLRGRPFVRPTRRTSLAP